MKRVLVFAGATLLVAAIVHVAVVWSIPRVVMSRVFEGVGGAGAVNNFLSPPPATSASRTIVRPSADLAYSVCILDLSAGPVLLEVPATAPYTSLALYSATTDNYFVRNNREGEGVGEGEPIGLVLTGPGEAPPANLPEGYAAVASPTSKSLALVRRVIENDAALPRLDEIRARSVCTPLNG
ncbi:protein of unknown function DUF1254 [Parvibaculum lavamentivorans DS-1]|uniref:DUF1254 domain-containing protein n=1 Tax=Parvibaculum lavamentivorans (strain DS-1 / DSM 13023 / NCIMB 13966) TaxID=402881 RepID=A7HRD2_PARL1|nr:DUF1254 domain-containing protein [Parvibaculum lavamentivorans]ABS62465.1 protein of unknown function DUF1254 [Parvibaculum lavamentivorans DS-1]